VRSDGDVRTILSKRVELFKRLCVLSKQTRIDFKEKFLEYVRECGGDICLRRLTGIYEYMLQEVEWEDETDSNEFLVRRLVLGMVDMCFTFIDAEPVALKELFVREYLRSFGAHHDDLTKKGEDFRAMFEKYVGVVGGSVCSRKMSGVYDHMMEAYNRIHSGSDTERQSHSEQSDEEEE
jgi:hypothetical protein